jgi:uncharacterized protein (TIGR02284 family)
MANPNDHAVHVLNSLIETTVDSADGYRKAAETADDPRFKTLFETRAQRRQQLSSQLKAEVRSFGGQPRDDGTLLGATHRTFLGLKDKVAGGSDKAVIEEVERGEDFIRDKFEKAARDNELPQQVRQLVDKACTSIKAEHDEVSALKQQMQ